MNTPQFTDSQIGVYENCASAYTREVEASWFCADHGIDGPDADAKGAAYDKGIRLRPVLALVPFDAKETDPRGSVYAGMLDRLALQAEVGLRPGDRDFMRGILRKRDQLIKQGLESVGASYGKGCVVDIIPSVTRYSIEVELADGSTVWPSTRPEFLAVIRDGKGVARKALIGDYKGFSFQGTEDKNASLRTQSVLVAAHFPTIDSTSVSLLGRTDLPDVTSQAYSFADLGTKHLDSLIAAVRASATLSQPLFDTGDATAIAPDHAAKLHENGSVGDHCFACKGKCCCTSLSEYITQHATLMDSVNEQQWGAIKAAFRPLAKTIEKDPKLFDDEDMPMTIDQIATISQGLEIALKPLAYANALKKDVNTVIRQLSERGHAVPNHTVKPGAPMLELKEEAGVKVSPEQAYELLTRADLFKGKSLVDFVHLTTEIDPTALRDTLAELHGCTKEEAMKMMSDRLKQRAPLVQSYKAGTVVVSDSAAVQAAPEVAQPIAKSRRK